MFCRRIHNSTPTIDDGANSGLMANQRGASLGDPAPAESVVEANGSGVQIMIDGVNGDQLQLGFRARLPCPRRAEHDGS
eukprot:799980-Pyramimonas_sp.AAC.1